MISKSDTRSAEAAPGPLDSVGSPLLRGWIVVATVLTILLAINQVFNFRFFVGISFVSLRYYYILMALLLPLIFLIWPMRGSATGRGARALDFSLSVATFAALIYLAVKSTAIMDEAWEFSAPPLAVACSVLLWIAGVEATRRTGGLVLAGVAAAFSIYPTIAWLIPGPIQGQATFFSDAATFYAMSGESYMGIPMRAFAGLIIGFLIFGVALQRTGGGTFFMDLAFSLLGHTRGGPAKVAIFASALMGSLSGSVITNILTTGTLTIPAMQKIGVSRTYAAGIETCASTGAVLMPPIMGATAFVMATFLETDYAYIAIAAIVPSVLYFLGLFVQIDGYAARNELRGIARENLPSVTGAIRRGWYYLFVFALLIFMLLYLKQEALAPYYATAALIFINQVLPSNRWSLGDVYDFIVAVGRILIELMGILMGIGLIIGALAVTGMTGTLTNDLIHIAGGNVAMLLLMGAIVSFVLGMGMTVTAAYIFLAVTLAPALVKSGIDPLPAHMFILYWGMLSYITPPVAIGAYAAASISGANAMRTGLVAMRLGSIIYIIPFLFVLSPTLLLQGSLVDIAVATATAICGVILIASTLQGYLVGVGSMSRTIGNGWIVRPLFFMSGLLMALPGLKSGVLFEESVSQVNLVAAAAILFVVAFSIQLMSRRRLTGE